MISRQQYKWLKAMQKKIKKRSNLDTDKKKRNEKRNFYLQAKNAPQNLGTADPKEQKSIIKTRKKDWKASIKRRNTPLNENDMKRLISKKMRVPKWKLINVQDFITGLGLTDYISQSGNKYDISYIGDIVLEEYRTEMWSKIWLPLLAIVIAIGALVVAIVTA